MSTTASMSSNLNIPFHINNGWTESENILICSLKQISRKAYIEEFIITVPLDS
jgi:hypothetical protein